MTRGPTKNEEHIALLRGVFDRGARLTKAEARARYGIGERQFRASVSALREQGYPVVSSSEEGSTYRKARSESELEVFIHAEIDSRAMDLLAQSKALRARARDHFPPVQLGMAI